MTTLTPTPARIDLLRDIVEGRLRWNERDGFNARCVSVHDRITDMETAGWVEITNSGNRQTVVVTDAGRAVLAATAAS